MENKAIVDWDQLVYQGADPYSERARWAFSGPSRGGDDLTNSRVFQAAARELAHGGHVLFLTETDMQAERVFDQFVAIADRLGVTSGSFRAATACYENVRDCDALILGHMPLNDAAAMREVKRARARYVVRSSEHRTPVAVEIPYFGGSSDKLGKSQKYLDDCIRDCIARNENPFTAYDAPLSAKLLNARASTVPSLRYLRRARKILFRLLERAGLREAKTTPRTVFYVDLGCSDEMIRAAGRVRPEKAAVRLLFRDPTEPHFDECLRKLYPDPLAQAIVRKNSSRLAG